MRNGETVAAFEREFAAYVGAKYAIALCNGTATLHTALVALGVKPGDRVAVPPLTMSATTMAVLHAGAVPVFCDVTPQTWLVDPWQMAKHDASLAAAIPVSLYGLHQPLPGQRMIDDAAQTLRPHGGAAFTSWSFQASKVLSLGEGGMLATNDEALAERARSFSSLGYRMAASQPRIDPAVLKRPDYARHHTFPAWNYRMNDMTAGRGLGLLTGVGADGRSMAERYLERRASAAAMYRDAIAGCDWITAQHIPDGWTHDMWSFAVALDTPERWTPFTDAIVRHGGEMPYGCWQITYKEPAFAHLAGVETLSRDYNVMTGEYGPMESHGPCPIAERLQPRLVQFQTNDLASAERNAAAVRLAIQELS